MSEKAKAFLDELRGLCLRHKVCLAVSDYDSLQVFDLDDDQSDPIHAAGIDDMTKTAD